MLIRIVLVLFLIVSIWPAGVKAQDSTFRVNIASPNAASLGKYGDIPVSYQSGTPSISIPIYTASSGHLKHDISLSYHASGLKVQELASWVGTGWSLNAGGVITRAVRGGPDDRGFSTSNYSHGHYADYGYNSYLLSGANTIDDYNFARGFKDGEPDIFTFNFDGYVGSFISMMTDEQCWYHSLIFELKRTIAPQMAVSKALLSPFRTALSIILGRPGIREPPILLRFPTRVRSKVGHRTRLLPFLPGFLTKLCQMMARIRSILNTKKKTIVTTRFPCFRF